MPKPVKRRVPYVDGLDLSQGYDYECNKSMMKWDICPPKFNAPINKGTNDSCTLLRFSMQPTNQGKSCEWLYVGFYKGQEVTVLVLDPCEPRMTFKKTGG